MRFFSTIILSLLSLNTLFGAVGEDGTPYLKQLTRSIEEIESYRVLFTLELGDEALEGEYIVKDGESYYLTAGTQRISGNSSEREIVDSYNHEIIRERVNSSTPMLMANPATAFLSLDKIFESKVVAHEESYINLELHPREDKSLFESVTLLLSATNYLPLRMIYRADGDEVVIAIDSFELFEGSLPTLDQTELEKYEVVDLR